MSITGASTVSVLLLGSVVYLRGTSSQRRLQTSGQQAPPGITMRSKDWGSIKEPDTRVWLTVQPGSSELNPSGLR